MIAGLREFQMSCKNETSSARVVPFTPCIPESFPSKMLHVSNEPTAYGPAMMAFVDDELTARGETPTAFATRNGISVAQFGRWRSGESTPRIEAVVQVAEALDVDPLDLLAITIGAVRDGRPVEPVRTPPPSITAALAAETGDATLSEGLRESLRGIVAAMRKFQDSSAPSAKAGNHPRRRNGS